MLSRYEKVNLVIATSEVPKGTEFTKENVKKYFSIQGVDKSLQTEQSIEDLNKLVGLYANEKIKAKDVISKESFSNHKDVIADLKDPVEVSFAISSFSDGVSGTIRKNDIIDIFYVDSNTHVATLAMPNVAVSSVYDTNGNLIQPGDDVTKAISISVYIEKEKETEFVESIANQNIKIVKQNLK
jgi:hypothetical protein